MQHDDGRVFLGALTPESTILFASGVVHSDDLAQWVADNYGPGVEPVAVFDKKGLSFYAQVKEPEEPISAE